MRAWQKGRGRAGLSLQGSEALRASRRFVAPHDPNLAVRLSRFLLLVGGLLQVGLAWAAEPVPVDARDPACVGLVLGGGGARGAAHIGVLKVMEREHIPVCEIAGTSMGAIVGGLYASGYTSQELETLVSTLDWADLFVDDPPRDQQPMHRKDGDFRYLLDLEIGFTNGKVVLPGGLVQGQKLLILLRRLTLSTWDVHDFDALPIPFRAVAADIGTGEKVVFDQGELALAIRSSMSVPGAFAPLKVDGRLLVDGGMVDNVPVDVVRSMGASKLVVVDVGSPLHEESALTNPVVIMDQMISALMKEKTERQLATLGPSDVLITPELGDLTAAEFNRGGEAIRQGELAAEAALPQLRRYSVDAGTYASYRERQRKRNFDPQLISFLDVVGSKSPSARKSVENALASNVGKPLDVDALEGDLGLAYGSNHFQQLDYRLVERDGRQGLEVRPMERPWSVFGRLGFQLSDDFDGRNSYLVSAEVTATNLNRFGAEWLNIIRAGEVSGLYSEFHQPLGEGSPFYVQPSLLYQNEVFPLWRDGQQLAEYRVNQRALGMALAYTPDTRFRVSANVLAGQDRGDRLVGSPVDFQRDKQPFAGVVYNATWDSLDNIDFPTRGLRVTASLEAYRKWGGTEIKDDVARLTVDWAHAWGRYHLLLGAYLASSVDDTHYFRTQQFLGGFLNLSGFHERAVFGNQSALFRSVAYRRTGDTSQLFSLPLFVGASLEVGNAWLDRSLVDADDLVTAGSLFAGVDTPLGPMFLAYGYNEEGQGSWYLTFGSLLRPQMP